MIDNDATVEEDVIFEPDIQPDADVKDHRFTTFPVLPGVVNESHECFVVGYGEPTGENKRGKDHQKIMPLMRKFRHTMSRILHRRSELCKSHHESPTPPQPATMNPDNSSGSADQHPTKVSGSIVSLNHKEPIDILFASHGTIGIVDLGASQTVMGCHQQEEFLSQLPREIRDRVRYRPVSMSFRFGNNGTVTCDTAMLVPVGPIWLKIALVPSTTPFLISNNVFRQLHAVIHTAQQKVVFEKLGCEVPLKLSDRKLFVMDLCDMIRSVQTQSSRKRSEMMPSPAMNDQTILNVNDEVSQTGDQGTSEQQHINSKAESISRAVPEASEQSIRNRQPDSAQSACDSIVTSNVVPCGPSCRWQVDFRRFKQPQKADEEILDLSRVTYDELQNRVVRFGKGQDWNTVSSSCSRRPRVGSVVCRPLCKFNETLSHGVSQVCGTCTSRRWKPIKEAPPAQTKKDNKKIEPEEQGQDCQAHRAPHRLRHLLWPTPRTTGIPWWALWMPGSRPKPSRIGWIKWKEWCSKSWCLFAAHSTAQMGSQTPQQQ